jgi:hypothetical protein
MLEVSVRPFVCGGQLMIPKTARSNLRSIAVTCASLAFIGWGCANNGGGSITGTGGSPAQTGGSPGTGGVPAGTGGSPQTTGTGGIGASGTGGSDVGTGGITVSSTGGSVGTGGVGGKAVGTGGIQSSTGGATGAPDAGSTTGPIAAGGDSKCSGAPPTIGKMCEGFEGTNSMKFSLGGNATGVVDSTKPYRGKMSAHMTTPTGANAMAFLTEMATFDQAGTAAKNNEMWGRVFVWINITGAAPISHTVFMTLDDPTDTATDGQFHLAGGSRGLLSAQIQQPNDKYKPAMIQTAGTGPAGSITYPFKPVQWQCWEWHTTAANTLEFYVDNQPYTLMTLTAADKWTFPNFRDFQVGFKQYSNTPAAEFWVDEVAIDTARIGCGN